MNFQLLRLPRWDGVVTDPEGNFQEWKRAKPRDRQKIVIGEDMLIDYDAAVAAEVVAASMVL